MLRLSALMLAAVLSLPATAVAQRRAFSIEDLYRAKNVAGFAVSPDEKTLIYVVAATDLPRAKRTAELWMSDAGGSNARQITFGSGNESDPSFSPDGKWIGFVSTREGSAQLYVMSVNGGEARKVTSISTGVSAHVWAPDSKAVAFASDVYPECGADDACNRTLGERWGEGPLKAHMTDSLLYRHWTEWKDGRRTHLMHVGIDDGAVRDLTPGDVDTSAFSLGGPPQFAFSPDGRELVVESKRVQDEARSTNNDLWAVALGADQPAAKNLTAANAAFDASPEYSPDGRYVAYRFSRSRGTSRAGSGWRSTIESPGRRVS